MLKPKLRFQSFSEDWKQANLKSVVKSIDSGWSPNCETRPANLNEWGVLKTTSVSWDGFNEEENKKLPNELDPRENYKVNEGDILITRAGPADRVGVIAIVGNLKRNLILSDKLIRIKVAPNCGRFFTYLLSTYSVQKQLKSKSSGLATSQTNISQKILLGLNIVFPFIKEQQKIADFLSVVDKKIELLTQKKELLEQYKKGVMQKLFNQEIRFKDEQGRDFGEWESVRLGEVGETYNGLSGKTSADFGEGYPYITYKQIFDNSQIDIDKFSRVAVGPSEKQSKAKLGDVFFTTSSETQLEVGFSSVLLDEVDTLYLNSFCFGYRIKDHKRFLPQYARFLFRSDSFRRKVYPLGQGSTRFNLSKRELMKVRIKLPEFEEQRRISDFLTNLDDKIRFIEKSIELTRQFKKGLLQQMFV